MDIAVQVSPQKESKAAEEEKSGPSIEEQLINELQNMFKRENLQNNSYLIYRMSNNLETPFEVIINENKIKGLSQDPKVVISALRKTPNLQVDEEKKLVTPIIPPLKNKIIISNVENGDQEELKSFLLTGIEDKECEFFFDRKNCCRVVFKDEIKTQTFFNWVSSQKFKNKAINAYFEPENPYVTFLQNIQEKKHFSKGGFNTSSMPFYSSAALPIDPYMYPPMPMMDPYYFYPPYMMADPYRFMPPPYYSNFFIRRANEDDESEGSEEDDRRERHYEPREKPYKGDYGYSGHQTKPKGYGREYHQKEYDRGYEKGYSKRDYDKGYYEKEDYEKPYYGKSYEKARDYKEKKPSYEAGTSRGKGYSRGRGKGPSGKKYYYEPKEVKVDPENFPPLIVKEEKEKVIEVTIMSPEVSALVIPEEKTVNDNTYSRKELVDIFKKLKNEKKISLNPALENPQEDVFHLVEKEGDIRLEFLDPKFVKVPTSTNTTPLMTGMNRPPIIMEERKEELK